MQLCYRLSFRLTNRRIDRRVSARLEKRFSTLPRQNRAPTGCSHFRFRLTANERFEGFVEPRMPKLEAQLAKTSRHCPLAARDENPTLAKHEANRKRRSWKNRRAFERTPNCPRKLSIIDD